MTNKLARFFVAVCFAAVAAMAGTGAYAGNKAVHKGAQEKGPTRLILLGTAGGPIPRKMRSQPASLVVVNNTPYLIDCGAGTLRQLVWAGFEPRDLAAIFITHHHLDHMAALPTLIAMNWMQRRKRPLPIIGPFGMREEVEGAYAFLRHFERMTREQVPGRLGNTRLVVARDIKGPGLIYKDANVRVTAAENTHYQLYPKTKDKSYAYRFDTADRSIVFTGDTGPSKNVVALAKGADVLVSEVILPDATIRAAARNAHVKPNFNGPIAAHMRHEHLTPEEVGKMAAAAGVKMVVLYHIAPGLDGETDMSKYSAGVKRYYHGPVIVGRDLLEL